MKKTSEEKKRWILRQVMLGIPRAKIAEAAGISKDRIRVFVREYERKTGKAIDTGKSVPTRGPQPEPQLYDTISGNASMWRIIDIEDGIMTIKATDCIRAKIDQVKISQYCAGKTPYRKVNTAPVKVYKREDIKDEKTIAAMHQL